MSNIWFPAPVALFLRRVVNVLSTVSITHHYLLPSRSSDLNAAELEPQRVGKVLRGGGKQDYVPWRTIMENGLGGILQASERLSIPYFRWPARLSLFQSTSWSALSVQQLNDSARMEDHHSSAPDHRPCLQEPPEPADRDRDNRREILDEIHRLMQNPVLYDPLRAPRYPIVLCHGLYGFDVRGPSSFPSLRMNYWSSILNILRKTVGADVIVTAVPSTGSIASRAERLDRFLQVKAPGRGINFMAHSMGGLDCRHLITHLKPVEYTPLSLTTIATPHRGSPFMDWCKEYLGLGRRRLEEGNQVSESTTAASVGAVATTDAGFSSSSSSSALSLSSLPSSFTTFLLSIFDSPAYANLTTTYLNEVFNLRTPDDPHVRYFSVAGRIGALNIWHPLWFPKLVLDGADGGEGNDGLVSVHSARWGEFLGTVEGADHWALRGASGIELGVDLPAVVSDAWGLADWGRFMRALRRVERRAGEGEGEGGRQAQGEEARKGRDSRTVSDDGLKSSTDRLSAVFDWLIEQVPVASRNAFSFAGVSGSGAGGGAGSHRVEDATASKEVAPSPAKARGDLESKRDLERLYVALARKLYDEGL
ncbi:Alpha/Beta hydrolase protein [Lactifluus subvellereus]|nr:Alpha/Beta hydrolase protein [Lactifluus subvellereus]